MSTELEGKLMGWTITLLLLFGFSVMAYGAGQQHQKDRLEKQKARMAEQAPCTKT